MKRPIGLYLAYLFQFLIAANIFIALSLGEYSQVFGGVLALGLTLVPAIVTRRGNITLLGDQPPRRPLALPPWRAESGFYEIYYPTTTRSLTSSPG